MKETLKFVREKETPGTVRFQEEVKDEDTPKVVGTLYIRKSSKVSEAESLEVVIEGVSS